MAAVSGTGVESAPASSAVPDSVASIAARHGPMRMAPALTREAGLSQVVCAAGRGSE
ncbi:hypothetical protein [Streptomyces sp. B8F3]|uniref:hypothetical protein n=1 Tax=unclassified Streptomyces TaxID=2593676 RepID=UPI00325D969E